MLFRLCFVSLSQSSSLLQEVQSVKTRASEETDQLRKKLASVGEENEVLVESLQELLLALQAKFDEESNKAHTAADDAEKCRSELKEVQEKCEAEMSSMKAQLAALSSFKGKEFEGVLLEKEKQLQVANEELESLQASMQSKSQECADSLEEITTLQSKINQLQKETGDRVKLEKNETITLHENLSLLEEQNSQLKEGVKRNQEQYQAELEKIAQDKNGLSAELESVREELELVKGRRQVEVEQARGSQEKEAAVHKEENKKLKAFAMKLKKELADSRERVSHCSTSYFTG